MEKVNTESKNITPSAVANQFDPAKHYNEVFGMFKGEPKQVIFEIDAKLLDTMIDRFGENIRFTVKDNSKLTFTAKVQISPQFIGWCCLFGNLLKVVAPTDVVEQVRTHVNQLNNLY